MSSNFFAHAASYTVYSFLLFFIQTKKQPLNLLRLKKKKTKQKTGLDPLNWLHSPLMDCDSLVWKPIIVYIVRFLGVFLTQILNHRDISLYSIFFLLLLKDIKTSQPCSKIRLQKLVV